VAVASARAYANLRQTTDYASTVPFSFWPTVLSVEPMVQYVVCLSFCLSVVCLSVCNVLYCGKTVRPSQKVSERVNRKPGSKSSFFGRRHISTSGFVRLATASFSWVSCLQVRCHSCRPTNSIKTLKAH